MKAIIPIADGTEEMEAVIIADVLRRAKVDARLVSITGSTTVTGSRGVGILANRLWTDAEDGADALILPGGLGGMESLRAHDGVVELTRQRVADDRLTAAICAAPLVLDKAGVLEGVSFTSHPSVRDQFGDTSTYSKERVVEDGCIITSQGPGTAMEFALAIITRLLGQPAADAVAVGLILP